MGGMEKVFLLVRRSRRCVGGIKVIKVHPLWWYLHCQSRRKCPSCGPIRQSLSHPCPEGREGAIAVNNAPLHGLKTLQCEGVLLDVWERGYVTSGTKGLIISK